MNYTPIQLKLPVDMENIIEINDSVYTFNEVVSHIDLKKYFVEKDYKATGRPRYEREKLFHQPGTELLAGRNRTGDQQLHFYPGKRGPRPCLY